MKNVFDNYCVSPNRCQDTAAISLDQLDPCNAKSIGKCFALTQIPIEITMMANTNFTKQR